MTFTGCGASRRPGPGQRSPEASAVGAARAVRRTADPGPARRAALRSAGPALPREAKLPPPPCWPSLARPRLPSAPAAHGSLKLAIAGERGAGLRSGGRRGGAHRLETLLELSWKPTVGRARCVSLTTINYPGFLRMAAGLWGSAEMRPQFPDYLLWNPGHLQRPSRAFVRGTSRPGAGGSGSRSSGLRADRSPSGVGWGLTPGPPALPLGHRQGPHPCPARTFGLGWHPSRI